MIGRKGRAEDVPVYQKQGTVTGEMLQEQCDVLHLELWLMSCRVLKRDMEYAMMDSIVEACRECGITTIMGYYYPTAKNAMVRDFYSLQGFTKIAEDEDGNSTWQYTIPAVYERKNRVITVNGEIL